MLVQNKVHEKQLLKSLVWGSAGHICKPLEINLVWDGSQNTVLFMRL